MKVDSDHITLDEICSQLEAKWEVKMIASQLQVNIPTDDLCSELPVEKTIIINPDGYVSCGVLERPADLCAVGLDTNIKITLPCVLGMLQSIKSLPVCHGFIHHGPDAIPWSKAGHQGSALLCKHSPDCRGLLQIKHNKGTSCDKCLQASNDDNPILSAEATKKVQLLELEHLLAKLGMPTDMKDLLVGQARNSGLSDPRQRRWTPR